MKGFDPEIVAILESQGVIVRREHRHLARSLDHLVSTGRLVALLPGVYARAPDIDLMTRMAAVMAWNPDAVLVSATAARASFWPDIPCQIVDVALRRRPEFEGAGFSFTKRQIPLELTAEWRGLRLTVPALTALDLCPEIGGDAIDCALRTGAAKLDDLWRAFELTPNRPGNRLRRTLLRESRSLPWSAAERRFHDLLRGAGITGWNGNVEVRGPDWHCDVDVAFEEEMLAAEVDGYAYHSSREAFENDRRRQNRLVLAGWTVLRFTPTMIEAEPELVVAQVQEALAQLRHGPRSSGSGRRRGRGRS